MRKLTILHRTLGLMTLGLLLIASTGCNKMLAKFTLQSAQKRTEEAAKQHDAAKFTPELLDQANAAINKGMGELQTGNFPSARETSKEAARNSKELLNRVKVAHANYLKEQALLWIKRADTNQAQQENAALFTQIQQDNEKGLRLIEKEKWDKSIVVFTKVNSDLNYLLKNLETKAKKALEETRQMKEDLVKEGAPEFAPEYVESMQQFIDQVDNFTNKEYNYRAAMTTRDQARQSKQEGIQKTKEVKSQRQLSELENLLETASNLGANIYAEQNFRTTTKQYEDLLTQFYEKNYDTVLAATPELKPRVLGLIKETKRESARAKMNSVQQAISNLVDSKAKTYLPGRVEQLEALLADAKQRFDEAAAKETDPAFTGDDYMESQKVSERALEVNVTIVQEFDALAQQEYAKASEALTAGEGVYNTMQAIFSQKVSGELAGDDKTLEESKLALKEELRAKLATARTNLGVSSLRRDEKNFDASIETAKGVAQTADEVTQQTYRVVAHNAILEIANQLTGLERFGGRQYAKSELDKTHELLDDSKKLLHGAQYRDAVRRAADTKAQLEVLTQEMERVAVGQIDKAQTAIGQARDDKAQQYQSDTYNQAINSLDQARTTLKGATLQKSIESGEQAEALAEQASQASLKHWTEEQMARTDQLLAQARKAGADGYAPDQLLKANDLRANVQKLYDQQSYRQAISAGDQAAEAANAALYSLVIKAEDTIASAKRAQGFEQQPGKLGEAIVAAKNARELTEQGQYSLGTQNALNAITLSSNVARQSKRGAFESRMAALTKHLEDAKNKGAGAFQNKDLAQIMGEMNRLRDEFQDKSYDDLARQIEVLESQLAGVVEMTPNVVNDLTASLQDRLQKLEGRDAKTHLPEKVTEVENKIKYAQLDFKNNKTRSSFMNALAASRQLDAIELNLDERAFDGAMNTQLSELSKTLKSFAPVLNMGSAAMTQMVIGMNGRSRALSLMGTTSPSDLRTAIAEIEVHVREIPTPETRVGIKANALQMLSTAKTAASNFEKILIMDQYGEKDAKEIVQTAFMQMYQARQQGQQVQAALEYPTSDLQPAGVERVVSYQGE